MTEPARLIQKHRANGLLIDTNLFLLYLVGTTNERRIATFKRTQKYTIEDFHYLTQLVAQFKIVVTTPHVLTEVSNLAKLDEPELRLLRGRFAAIIEKTHEIREASQELVKDGVFMRLGLADAAIARAAREPKLILTDDLDLYLTLQHAGLDAMNFNEIRSWMLIARPSSTAHPRAVSPHRTS
jgi:hypothetical protein